LSEKVPVAVNCTVVPATIELLLGVTATETRVGAVTLRLVDPITEASLAEIVVVCPEVTPVARPVAPTVATDVLEEIHVTVLVRSCVLLSEKVPDALN
jgi:hypothetical protein